MGGYTACASRVGIVTAPGAYVGVNEETKNPKKGAGTLWTNVLKSRKRVGENTIMWVAGIVPFQKSVESVADEIKGNRGRDWLWPHETQWVKRRQRAMSAPPPRGPKPSSKSRSGGESKEESALFVLGGGPVEWKTVLEK